MVAESKFEVANEKMVATITKLDEELETLDETELEKAKHFLQNQERLSPLVRRLLVALKARNFKVTAPRLLILEVIGSFQGEFTLNQLIDKLNAANQKVGVASIFRTVKLLTELNLLQRIHSADGCHRYTLEAEHHHQIVCRSCGQQTEFGGCELEDLAKTIEGATGFRLDGHWLEFFGHCANCRLLLEHTRGVKKTTSPAHEHLWIATETARN